MPRETVETTRLEMSKPQTSGKSHRISCSTNANRLHGTVLSKWSVVVLIGCSSTDAMDFLMADLIKPLCSSFALSNKEWSSSTVAL